MVTAQGAGTGGDKITHTSQASKGERMGTDGGAQAGDFCQTTSNNGSFGVVAITHAIAETSTDGDDVLEGSTKFDAYDIVSGVDAIVVGTEDCANTNGYLFRVGCDNGGGRLLLCHFTRKVRAAECSYTL